MALVPDIWHEIISYHNSYINGSTLLSLALSSRSLSKVVLPYLWRDLASLEPIVSVINSFADPDKVFLSYPEDDEGDDGYQAFRTHWVLGRSLPQSACERAKEYLSYIWSLSADIHCDYFRQTSLWPILFACLRCNGPLLPNLRHLDIWLHEDMGPGLPELDILLSSPLRVVEILQRDEWPSYEHTVVTIFSQIRNRGCDLHTLKYIGRIFSELHSTISQFQNLQSLLTLTELSNLHPEKCMASISFHEFLSSLPSLINLDCKMEHFIEPSRITQAPICHDALQVLDVSAAWGQGLNLFFTWRFPALSELTIQLAETEYDSGRQWKLFFELLASCCPRLRIMQVESDADDEFTFDDLTPIFALAIEGFHFQYGSHAISSSSLSCLLEAWPKLNTLSYCNSGHIVSGETPKVLSLLSRHLEMRNFNLNLDLSPLAFPVTLEAPSSFPGEKRSWVETIHLTTKSVIPDEPGALSTIVKNLLIFFPRLSHFSGGGIAMHVKRTSLNQILQAAREEMKQT